MYYMENNLYPIKFAPIVKPKIWGGESWMISGVEGDISVVENGFLAGNTLDELLEVYMGDLVGDSVYEKFGNEFPLLIKFINADDRLSVQVHPDDALAAERHDSFGKTEMWYVLDCKPGAELVNGFRREISKEEYLDALNSGRVMDILNCVKVKRGDVFFIPSGRVHAIGAGNYIAEIQQTSDSTYRIWDYNRPGLDGKPRPLHTELAKDALDYKVCDSYKTPYEARKDAEVPLVSCRYFTTSVLELSEPFSKDLRGLDSFLIVMCLEGGGMLRSGGEEARICADECILVPASAEGIEFIPDAGGIKVLLSHA